MYACQLDNLVAYQSSLLADPHLAHAAFSRLGGCSEPPFASLNIGETVGDDPARVRENLEHILSALSWRGGPVVSGHQVHRDHVHRATLADAGKVVADTDALLTDVPGLLLLGRYADCVPILLWDPTRRVVGLAHAGWRGTVRRIAIKTVASMVKLYGSRPKDIRAVIGPSIGPCCFQVGPKVQQEFLDIYSEHAPQVVDTSRRHVNLWSANALQLAGKGVKQIDVAELCTSCHVDSFYSHRREQGNTGRFGVAIGIRPA